MRKIFVNVLIRDSHAIEAARMKEIYNPAIKFYEIRYACKHGGRKFKSESTEWGHCNKSFFQWFCNCLRLKTVLNQLYYIQKSVRNLFKVNNILKRFR